MKDVLGNVGAFAAVKICGSVVTWGDETSGGDSDVVQERLNDVSWLAATSGAFAAIKTNGCVVTWGEPHGGGDSGADQEKLSSGVQHVVGNTHAFLALTADGSLVTWGDPDCGGHYHDARTHSL